MRVLIVEDHADTALLWSEIVRAAGHEVGAAVGSVEEALAAAPCPDLAIIDVGLRGPMIGIECAQLLRQQCPGLPVIFITGAADPVVVEAAMMLKPVAYLVKPVHPMQIAAALAAGETEHHHRTVKQRNDQ